MDSPFRICRVCGAELTVDQCVDNRNICKPCQSEYQRQYRKDHAKELKEYNTQYAKDHSQEAVERVRQWRRNNPDKKKLADERRRKARREKVRESQQKYRRKNSGKYKIYAERRRARKQNADGTHTYDDELAQLKRQKHKCYYCHEKIVGDKWSADHVVPISRGGSDWPENIVIVCLSCNSKKGAKLPHEWSAGGHLL